MSGFSPRSPAAWLTSARATLALNWRLSPVSYQGRPGDARQWPRRGGPCGRARGRARRRARGRGGSLVHDRERAAGGRERRGQSLGPAGPVRPVDEVLTLRGQGDLGGHPAAVGDAARVPAADRGRERVRSWPCRSRPAPGAGRTRCPRTADGASTIQSAEVMSIGETRTVRLKVVPRVRSLRVRVTRWPLTITLAFMTSPGSTRIRMLRDGAGTSSFQALDTTFPGALQSTSVPICSSALGVDAEASEPDPHRRVRALAGRAGRVGLGPGPHHLAELDPGPVHGVAGPVRAHGGAGQSGRRADQ